MPDLAPLINSAATHALQLDDGTYASNRSGHVTEEMLRRHLAGQITLAVPVVGDGGTCRVITIDDDAHKRDEDTAEVRRDILARAVTARSVLVDTGVVSPSAILSILTGGKGSHTDVLLDDESAEEVVPVAHALQALVGDVLGTEPRVLEAFPSTCSSAATGGSCRIVRLPGFHRPMERWSEVLCPTDNGWRHPAINTIRDLGVRPLSHREFSDLRCWAEARKPDTDRWFGRRIQNAPTARRLPRSLASLAHAQRFCAVFRDSLSRIRNGDQFDWLDAIFVGSIAGQVDGALETITKRGRAGGYAAELLRTIEERQRGRVGPAMTCRAAQQNRICPEDCLARRLTGARTPANFLAVSDPDWLAKRITYQPTFSLAEARAALATEFDSAIRAHLLKLPAPRSLDVR